jgi:hypothetical protein
MSLSSLRVRVGTIALVAAFAVACLMPLAASAAPGGIGEPATLTVPCVGATGTLLWDAYYGDYSYYYCASLKAGQTVSVTSTIDPTVGAGVAAWSMSDLQPYAVFSNYVSDSVANLKFMAPSAGVYWVNVIGVWDGAADFSLDATTVPAVRFTLGAMSAPKYPKHTAYFTASMKLYKGYNSTKSPIRLYVQRKVSGHWKAYTSKAAGLKTTPSNSYSTASAKFKLPKGTFRIRARFLDAAHKTAKYNSYKTVYVK